ncbi:MAG: hypothetical protein KAR06_05140 [Deltaproteobacteria bacterium]|nr:hypothetical protein [Deltaproteobacteria bacterium]
MFKKIIVPMLVLALVVSSSLVAEASFLKKNKYEVKFGIMDKSVKGAYLVKEETLKIPKLLKETGFAFGFTVRGEEDESFAVAVEIKFPEPPKVITSQSGNSIDDTGQSNVLTFSAETDTGELYSKFGFDEGDPLGKYKITIRVDGKVIKKIKFTVFEPDNN